MSKIKMITDSTADIPKELVKEYNITVVPLTVLFGEESYRDSIDIDSKAFFEKLKTSAVMPTTAQVTPAAFEEVFSKELETYDTLICVSLSSKASGTYQSAMIAKGMMEDADIEVIDSRTFSYGYGMIVVEAAKMAQQGEKKQEIVAFINDKLSKLDTYFIVDTLEFLKRGGRIKASTAMIGNILNIKPLLSVEDGMVVSIDKIRGSKNIIPKMVKLMKEKGYNLSGKTVGLSHGAMPERLEELKEAITKEFNPKEFCFSEVGSVIGTHTGPGVIGFFCIKD